MRRVLPGLVALGAGVIILLDYLLEHPLLDMLGGYLLDGAVILGACALLLGLMNLLLVNERRIRRRERGWGASAVILVSALASLGLGLVAWQTPAWAWFYRSVLFPLEAGAGALLAFAVAGAAVRTWRFGSVEGALLLVVGLVVLLGSLPLGGLQVLAPLRDWIMAVPVLAAVRGILLGVALGVVATGLRVLVGVDRPYE
ncbi:MAG TPA: hypothetical protein PLJ35_20220 [Anaerolineae bacterium]|nr:hypothetical protein [Anaerolineae bacterium]HPL30873.1 hypothetical protein [Anaerolineae bacterium]